LKRLADANPDIFSVFFCRTKRDTQAVAEKLVEDGYMLHCTEIYLKRNVMV
jgi:ATP-dependent RNA helicase DeaD